MLRRSGMKFRSPWLWGLTLGLLLIDRLTKVWILNAEELPTEVIPGFLNLVRVTNTGIAFGMLSGISPSLMNPLLSIVGIIVCLAVLYFLLFHKDPPLVRFSLHLLLAGAVGNIWDRIAWGEVVDFIDVHLKSRHWPSFNVADACISVGLVLILISLLFPSRDSHAPETD